MKYYKEESIVLRNIEGVNILIPTKKLPRTTGNRLYEINETMSFIWELSSDHHTINETAYIVVSKYDIHERKAFADVKEILDYFVEVPLDIQTDTSSGNNLTDLRL